MERPLFGDASEQDVLRILADDWNEFAAVAYILIGRVETWDAALAEVEDLDARFFREGMDRTLLDPLFWLLLSRLAELPEPLVRLERLMSTLAAGLPQSMLDRIKRDIAMTPAQRRQQNDRDWLAAYMANKKAPASLKE